MNRIRKIIASCLVIALLFNSTTLFANSFATPFSSSSFEQNSFVTSALTLSQPASQHSAEDRLSANMAQQFSRALSKTAEREFSLHKAGSESWDIILIGGGIAGLAIAAFLAKFSEKLNLGLKIAIIAAEDIASGASSNSTGLRHAGVRYLYQLRLWHYVFTESGICREVGEVAPHLSPFIDFYLAVFRRDAVRKILIRFGLWIYDKMAYIAAKAAGAKPSEKSRWISRGQVIKDMPDLKREGLVGAQKYSVDGLLPDSRYAVGFARIAVSAGATILTHAEVTGISQNENSITLTCIDHLLQTDPFLVTGRFVLNATGWMIDRLRHLAGFEGMTVLPSQGGHVITKPGFRLGGLTNRIAMVFQKATKGAVYFVLPFEDEQSKFGTTDTSIGNRQYSLSGWKKWWAQRRGKPIVIKSSDYVEVPGLRQKDMVAMILPILEKYPHYRRPNLTDQEAAKAFYDEYCLGHTCGVRPLGLEPGGSSLSASREDRLIKDSPQFWSIAGVKLTAALFVGRKRAREILQHLTIKDTVKHIDLGVFPGAMTGNESFSSFVARMSQKYPNETQIRYLARLYGTELEDVLALANENPDLGQFVLPGKPWVYAQVNFAVDKEMALTLSDVLWRRTRWALSANLSIESIEKIADLMAAKLEWTPKERSRQINQFNEEMLGSRQWPSISERLYVNPDDFDALFLDWDGALADTYALAIRIEILQWHRIAANNPNLKFEDIQARDNRAILAWFKSRNGLPTIEHYRAILEKFNPALDGEKREVEIHQLLQQRNDLFDELAGTELKNNPDFFHMKGIQDWLVSFHERYPQKKIFLVSGTSQNLLEQQLGSLRNLFDSVTGGINKAIVFPALLRDHGLSSDRVLVIGDGVGEIRAAHHLYVPSIGLAQTEMDARVLIQTGADRIVRAITHIVFGPPPSGGKAFQSKYKLPSAA